jgi:uncharacterized protein YjbJ (UPF0337 family)
MPGTPDPRHKAVRPLKSFLLLEPFGSAAVFRWQGRDDQDRVLNLSRRLNMGSTSDKISGAANQVAGKAKQAAGKVTDNDKLRAEGKGQEVKGKVQSATGKAKDAVKGVVDRM